MLDDPPGFHHEFHIFQDADPLQRITADRDDIDDRAGLQSPHLARYPEHFGIKCAVRNDYLTFAERELSIREETGYPPFTHLLRIVFSGEDLHEVERLALEMANAVNRSLFDEGTKLLGPTRAPITMINGRYRWHMLVKSMKRGSLDLFAETLKNALRKQKRAFSKSVRMSIDMDPISML